MPGHRQGFPTPSGGSHARSLGVIIKDLWYDLPRLRLIFQWMLGAPPGRPGFAEILEPAVDPVDLEADHGVAGEYQR